jgi:hypothetical protein
LVFFERFFSQGANIISKDRNKLNKINFEKILYFRSWGLLKKIRKKEIIIISRKFLLILLLLMNNPGFVTALPKGDLEDHLENLYYTKRLN